MPGIVLTSSQQSIYALLDCLRDSSINCTCVLLGDDLSLVPSNSHLERICNLFSKSVDGFYATFLQNQICPLVDVSTILVDSSHHHYSRSSEIEQLTHFTSVQCFGPVPNVWGADGQLSRDSLWHLALPSLRLPRMRLYGHTSGPLEVDMHYLHPPSHT